MINSDKEKKRKSDFWKEKEKQVEREVHDMKVRMEFLDEGDIE